MPCVDVANHGFIRLCNRRLKKELIAFAALFQRAAKIDELTDLLITRNKELESLAAVYREISRKNQNGIVDGYVRRCVAFRSPCLFFRDNSHGHARLDWHNDPLRKTLLIHPNENILLDTLNRVILNPTFTTTDAAPLDVQNELLFRVLCWWPYTDWPPPKFFGRSWSMTSLLTNEIYRLRSDIVILRGRRCVVLEKPGIDILWLDASTPHCVLRREVFNDKTGALAWRCDYDGYMNYGGNMWLPQTFTNQLFDSYASSKESQERLVVNAKFKIMDIRVNSNVVEEDFQLNLLPGTVRRDIRDGTEYFHPLISGQQDHANSIIKWASSVVRFTEQTSSSFWDFCRIAIWSIPWPHWRIRARIVLRNYSIET